MLKRILFATDFSACAGLAQDYAICLAKAFKAEMDIVHVLELYPGMDVEYPVNHLYLEHLRKQTDQQLEGVIDQIRKKGVPVKSHQIIGMPSLSVTESAKTLSSDLIVLGTHGRTGLERVLLGSTAERVVAGAPCPVLAVRQGKEQNELRDVALSLRRILIPIDFSECSLEALEFGALMARQFGGSAMLLHVLEPVSYGLDFALSHALEREKVKESVESRLTRFLDGFKSLSIPASFMLRGGLPADGILHAAQESDYDLIVMGTHGRRGLSHLISGSVAEAVLRRASCPVLTVKRSTRDLRGYPKLFAQEGNS